jgi:hypothetical protein
MHTDSESLEKAVHVERWGHPLEQQRSDTALGRYSPDALATAQHPSDQSRTHPAAAAAGGGAKQHPKLTAQLLRQAQQQLSDEQPDQQRYAQLREEFLGSGGASMAPSVGGQTDRDRHDLISTDSDESSDA